MPRTALTALQRKTLIALLGVGVFFSSVGSHAASPAEKKLPPKPAPVKKPAARSSTTRKPAVKSGRKTATRKSSYNSRRPRSQSFRSRLARLKLQPERISEIQQGLIGAGYLNQTPNGQWDDSTRDAMRRFQQSNGFPITGLPEAKSLMKLGLGPHPLPEELDATAQARPAAAPLSEIGTPATPTETSPGADPQQ